MDLGRNRNCRECPLWEGVSSVCVPSREYAPPRGVDKALFVVGEAPGREEDASGQAFVGRSGQFLSKVYLEYFKFPQNMDVYLGNVVRCRPPGNATPNKTQIKACHVYLMDDLRQLQQRYKEVIVLAVGGSAITTFGRGKSIKASLKDPGAFSKLQEVWASTSEKKKPGWVWPKEVAVFTTYHPAYCLRSPEVVPTVGVHLQGLKDYTEGKLDYDVTGLLQISSASPPPSPFPGRISLDIETYGFMEGFPKQTQFHPRKMEAYDGVPKNKQIATCGLSWRDPEGLGHHTIFRMSQREDRRILWSWLRNARDGSTDSGGFEGLVGQNLPFDIMCLRYCYPECKRWLDVGMPLIDLMVTNYLHDEGRPEKSLKLVAPMLRIAKYEEKDLPRYKGQEDPELWQYNCLDTWATLLAQEKFEKLIAQTYGKDTPKLSEFSRKWYSDLLWLLIWMQEEGVSMREKPLSVYFKILLSRQARLTTLTQKKWSVSLTGTGSQTARRAIVQEAIEWLEEAGLPVPKLELTPKTKAVSFGVINRNSLQNALPGVGRASPEPKRKLRMLGRFQDLSGLLDRYLYPLLVGRGPKHSDPTAKLLGGVAYPRWYPVPSEWEDGSFGGTKQSRIVCKGPPIQTFPPVIKKTITTRFPRGYLLWFDYSQIELRVAALLSGDDAFLQAYRDGLDLHALTAELLFGKEWRTASEARREVLRFVGKTLNFLTLFRGGAEAFQEAVLRKLGWELPLVDCHGFIDRFWDAHRPLRAWQDQCIKDVKRSGYFQLPLIGQSRLFLGGPQDRERSINEIVNMPIQSNAASITISAHFDLWSSLRRDGFRAVFPINVYDSAAGEIPRYELPGVLRRMETILPKPSFLSSLEAEVGRTVPLAYEYIVYDSQGNLFKKGKVIG